MDQEVIDWLAGNRNEFPRLSIKYGVSVPTLYKIADGNVAKLQRRIIKSVLLAYKKENK